MAVSPEVLLEAAAVLGLGNSEADWRNAASRAYYAAFHSCVSVARHARLNFADTGSVHAALIGALTDGLSPTPLKGLGYMLEQCRRRRTDADYRIEQEFPRQIADTIVADCRKILEKADSIRR